MTFAICSELTIFAFFSFLTVVFLALWSLNFFLTFCKASTSYGYFHYVSYGFLAHWFSLDQMFKFSVSFATKVEKKNWPSHGCFNRGRRPKKTQREQPDTILLQQITYVTWNPCCYPCILVHLNGWKVQLSWFACGCNRFVLYFFYFSVVCYK